MIQLSGPILPPPTGEKPTHLIVLLHGLGADGHDLLSLGPVFQHVAPGAVCVSPHAPFRCDMAPFGYQWFSLKNPTPESVVEGVKTTAPILTQYLKSCLQEYALSEENMILIGFSQGAMMALYCGLRLATPCAGILGYSGALVAPEALAAEVTAPAPICLIHGEEDMVVPFAMMGVASAALKSLSLPLEAYGIPGLGHSIDDEGLWRGKDFIKRCFKIG